MCTHECCVLQLICLKLDTRQGSKFWFPVQPVVLDDLLVVDRMYILQDRLLYVWNRTMNINIPYRTVPWIQDRSVDTGLSHEKARPVPRSRVRPVVPSTYLVLMCIVRLQYGGGGRHG